MTAALTTASIFSDFYGRLVEHEEQGLFWVLAGFIGSFASASGVPLHPLGFGIVAMMIAGALGFLSFGRSPHTEICAAFFGIGAGLTIDEFALWVHLEDVYWSEQGRSSIDATVIAVAAMGLILVGLSPFTFETDSASAVIGSVITAIIVFGSALICFLKGRIMHGTVGIFFFPIAIYGACRIGKPTSIWGRHRY